MTRWVLLRGLTREAGHWGALPHLLARGADGEVLTPDLPGTGLRWRDRSPASVAGIAKAVRAQATLHEPAWLVGMSLGGMVAIEWALSAPHEVAGCVVLNMSAAGCSPPWRRLQPRQYATIARLLLPGVSLAERERRVLAMTSNSPHGQAHLVPAWTAIAETHPVSAGNALRQLWAASRYRAPSQAPALPILLLASQADRLVHPSCSQRLADRWNAPLRAHPDAGHDLALDDPAWVVEQLVRWRASLAPM